MTPNDIATDIANLNHVESETHGLSMNYTYCAYPQRMDDSNTWD